MPTKGYFQPALRIELKNLLKEIRKTVPELKNANDPTTIEYCLQFTKENYKNRELTKDMEKLKREIRKIKENLAVLELPE